MPTEATFDSAPESGTAGSRRIWIGSEFVYPSLCCAVTLACILLANPSAPEGFADDWSYADVALKLAQTGHFHYNGWGSPTIVFQSIWGALWIHAFGFSFNVLRIATVPFSLGFVWLVYLIGRRVGLTEASATFGALVVGTSPLFLPLAASFMTEPYACFFTALCIYAAIRGVEDQARWLWVLTLAGVVGGADRQSVWVAPITLIPYLYWVKRSNRQFRRHAIAAYVLCLGCIALLVHYFMQPYGPLQLSNSELIHLLIRDWLPTLGRFSGLLLSCLLVALPALLCFAPLWKNLEPAVILLLLLGSGIAVVALMFFFGRFGVAPFAGDILTPFGIFWEGEDALGQRPAFLSLKIRIALAMLLVFSIAAFLCLRKSTHSDSALAPRAIFAIFSGSHVLLLLPIALATWSFDRYVLPLVPLVVIYLLMRYTCHGRKLPIAAWGCSAVFACYSVATTHDFFSALRARCETARLLEARGVPREHVSAGFEYDGWTQLQLKGRIVTPRYGGPGGNTMNGFWFWPYTTAVRPDYVVAYSQGLKAVEGLPSLSFKTWLPPFRRYVTVFKRADLPKPTTAQ